MRARQKNYLSVAVPTLASDIVHIEEMKKVGFNRVFGTFFLIWFYPFGIWFVQPRINNLNKKTRKVQ